MRFSTTELGELEAKIANAADRALALELEIFDRLAAAVAADSVALKRGGRRAWRRRCRLRAGGAGGRARLCAPGSRCQPGLCNHAAAAIRWSNRRWRPTAARSSPTIAICRRRLGKSAGRIWLITGPNMAGKSTFLRQNALIAVLAQMGSFVPARAAHIGVIDRLFSRVGAADDLARGRSTFMVEMVETAAILNQAGERALVILDEIGRGTATFDGLSIAWATIEHLHENNRCRALFATHFHEMTALAAKLPRLHNATMRVKEWQGEVVFLHEVVPGAADRSYGIQVAKLAGLPPSVIERAKIVLAQLEAEDRMSPARKLIDDLPLFAAAPAPAPPRHDNDAALTAPGRGACGASSGRDVAARSAGSALRAQGAVGEDEIACRRFCCCSAHGQQQAAPGQSRRRRPPASARPDADRRDQIVHSHEAERHADQRHLHMRQHARRRLCRRCADA